LLSIKLHIKDCNNYGFIHKKQQNYSGALRFLYKNITSLDKDKEQLIKTKFSLNEIEFRSVRDEAKTKFNQTQTNKDNLIETIIELSDEIKSLQNKPRTKKNIRELFKLNKKLTSKNKSLPKDITFGGRDNLKKISYLSNDKEANFDKLTEYKQIYKDNRLLGLYLLGEANKKSNRFFKFDLNNNLIYYKPKKGIKIKLELNHYRNYKQILIKLQELINNKEIAITVRLTKSHIVLTFDEEKFSGYNVNVSERTKEVNLIKDKNFTKEYQTELIKEVYKKYYDENKTLKLSNKKVNRYFAIDSNPDYLGCSIIDKIGDEIKVIKTFYYDLTELNDIGNHKFSNKRKHGLKHVWKNIFQTIKYYKCAYFINEELDLKSKDIGVKEANRKINNLWYRGLSEQLTNKYCNKLGIIQIGINPCYSSFIGNMMYDYVDPVNASIEIGRRGIFKYYKNTKGKSHFYPILDVGTIMNTVLTLNGSSDVSFLKDSSSWVDSYRKVGESGLRYRATLEDFKGNFNVVLNLNHSKIKKLIFINKYS
jgi:hypothetical protein